MAKSRSESSVLALPLLKVRGVRGVMKTIRQGERTMPGPGKNALPYFLTLEGRGLR
jgi:hypothetical protein